MRIPILHDLTDEELVVRAKNGSDAASALLVDRYTTAVYRLALGITKSHHDAEDIVQETFVMTFRHIGDFSPEKASFKTWILTIARNQSINAFSFDARQN